MAGLCRCQHLYKPGDLEQRISECAGPGVGQHQKRWVAQLPCGDIMTKLIKVCFILPLTQAKIWFIIVLPKKIISLGIEGGQQGRKQGLNSPQFLGGPQESVRDSALAHRKPPQLWGRERDPPLEEPTFEVAPSQVGGEASSPAIAREKWGSNHSKASSPFSHLLRRHCLYRERFGRI